MKKSFKIACLLVFLTSPLMLLAQQVSSELAKQKALTFLTKSDKSSTKRSASNKTPRLVLANDRDEFYIFNDEANGGYVVVSGDERMPDVLGYSYTGHFDAENIPCNMRAWLEDYANQVIYLRSHPEVQASRRAATERKEISPLLKCHFDQGKYYNDKCPIKDGGHAVTGCVATAMAQIMYYYQWPKQTADIIPDYTTRTRRIAMPAIPVTTIDWDNMLEQYKRLEKYSDKQIDAISTLMLLCGTSVKMDYATEIGSSASSSEVPIALRKYFDYDDLVEFVGLDEFEYGLDEWVEMLYDELNDGRPVLYSGKSDNVGHAFVLDGYRDGYFHINWGWSGSADDYYLLTDLNGYKYNHEAVVGIRPNNDDYPSRYALLDNGKMTLYYDKERSHRSGTILPRQDDWSNYAEQITECIIDPSFANLEMRHLNSLFSNLGNLKSITGLENLNTSKVTDMSQMFSGCSSLTSLDVSGFNTENVSNMDRMFSGCSGLTSLDLSGFNTEKVCDMGGMFSGCRSLTSIDVSGFNTKNVRDMGGMFSGCRSLTSLDVSGFNAEYVRSISSMFSGCSSLTSLDLSNFNTYHVTYMGRMFSGCSSLTNLDVSGFNTDRVTDMRGMFEGCSSLTNLDLSGFKTDNVTEMEGMFSGCSSLTNIDVSGFNTEKVWDMGLMFYDCLSLTNLDVSGFNTENVSNMGRMFRGCLSLTSLDVSGFNTDRVTDMESMFSGCSGLTNLDVSGFNTENVSKMGWMFSGCSSLTNLDMSGFRTDQVTDMRGMFCDCSGLTSLDLSGFNTEKVCDMDRMFSGCSGLTSLDVSGVRTDQVTDMESMFSGCSGLTNLDVSGFNTENVSNMREMFRGCSSLTSLDLSGFKTDNVTYMSSMFSGCSSLTTIYASEYWNMSNVVYSDYMFNACNSLVGGAGTTYNSQHKKGDYAHIDGGPENPGYFTYKASKFHTIIYIIEDKVYLTQTYKYGDQIVIVYPPAREGYDFAWIDLPETMPDHDITIYGSYTLGIKDLLEEKHPVKVFSLEGRPQNKMQKGINIIRYSDGSVGKVLVK